MSSFLYFVTAPTPSILKGLDLNSFGYSLPEIDAVNKLSEAKLDDKGITGVLGEANHEQQSESNGGGQNNIKDNMVKKY